MFKFCKIFTAIKTLYKNIFWSFSKSKTLIKSKREHEKITKIISNKANIKQNKNHLYDCIEKIVLDSKRSRTYTYIFYIYETEQKRQSFLGYFLASGCFSTGQSLTFLRPVPPSPDFTVDRMDGGCNGNDRKISKILIKSNVTVHQPAPQYLRHTYNFPNLLSVYYSYVEKKVKE